MSRPYEQNQRAELKKWSDGSTELVSDLCHSAFCGRDPESENRGY